MDAVVDHLIPSVEEAARDWAFWSERTVRADHGAGCPICDYIYERREMASIAYDLAVAASLPPRRVPSWLGEP